jgi:chemotaxis protein MotC
MSASKLAFVSRLALAAAMLGRAPALGAEVAPQPYELVRALRSTQDRIADGDRAAFLAYRTMLSEQAALLARVADDAWQDPRNVRAAVAFVLSGGDPAVLRKLVALTTGRDQALVKAALAYGENRNSEAAKLLADLDPRALDQSIAGHIALVHSEILSKKQPEKAMALLDDARLLAPGTMIEEAALRREAALAAEQGAADRFEKLAIQYLRRFPRSVHMPSFQRQLAQDMAKRAMADDADRRTRMEAVMSDLTPARQADIYLAIAWEGTKAGKVDLVRWAARNAARLAEEGSPQQRRARLCEAAVLVVTEEIDAALAVLNAMPADQLDAEEEGLLAAALRLAGEMRRAPVLPPQAADPPAGAVAAPILATARTAMARVDALLSGGGR